MGALIPAALDWATISADIATFMGNALIVTLIGIGIAFKVVPKVVRTIKRST